MQLGHGSGCFWKEHLRSNDQELEQKMQNSAEIAPTRITHASSQSVRPILSRPLSKTRKPKAAEGFICVSVPPGERRST